MRMRQSPMFRLLCLCALVGSLTATTGCSALSALFGKKGADAGTEDPGTDDIDQATDDTDVVDDIEDVVDVPDVKKDAADAKY